MAAANNEASLLSPVGLCAPAPKEPPLNLPTQVHAFVSSGPLHSWAPVRLSDYRERKYRYTGMKRFDPSLPPWKNSLGAIIRGRVSGAVQYRKCGHAAATISLRVYVRTIRWPQSGHYGQRMTPSSESDLLIHFGEFALAQSVKRELVQLRARTTIRTSEDVMLLARKAALNDSPCRSGRAAVDKVQVEACLAICRLSAAIEQDQPETNTSLLWARAIDLAQAWVRTAEPPLNSRITIPTDIEVRSDPSPPEESSLSSDPSISAETNGAAGGADEGAAMLRETLVVIPIGSAITFAAKDIGILLGTTIVYDPEVELLAQSCACSVGFQKETGTISFYRNEIQPGFDDAIKLWAHAT
jgi:hypothetical protein